MRNSTIVTNSEFTRKIIVDAFGIDYNSIYVLRPPIDIDIFRNVELMSAQVQSPIYDLSRKPGKDVCISSIETGLGVEV